MGALDAAMKEFMSDDQNFADMFNIGLFHEPLIEAGTLKTLDTDLVSALFKDGEKRVTGELERWIDDIHLASVAKYDKAAAYVVLGAEYQALPHEAMPVRVLLDIGLAYARQVREIARSNREAGRLSESGAFLSGLLPGDRLYPVILLVLYLGEEPWNGPRSLWEMLDTQEKKLLKYCVDCKINLVTPEDIEDKGRYHDSQFWKAMRVIAAGHQGKSSFLALTKEKPFELMRNDAVRLVNTVLHTNIEIKNGKGGYTNMCKAMREINEEIAGMCKAMREINEEIAGYKGKIAGYDQEIAEYKTELSQKDDELARMARRIAELEAQRP